MLEFDVPITELPRSAKTLLCCLPAAPAGTKKQRGNTHFVIVVNVVIFFDVNNMHTLYMLVVTIHIYIYIYIVGYNTVHCNFNAK